MSPRMLRLKEVMLRTGLARSTVYLRIQQQRFPKPTPLGSPHIVGWLESDVNAWIEEQVRASRSDYVPTSTAA